MKFVLEVSVINTINVVVEAENAQDVYDLIEQDSKKGRKFMEVIYNKEMEEYDVERDYNVYHPRYEYSDDEVDFKIS